MHPHTALLSACLTLGMACHACASLTTERTLTNPDGTLVFTLERDDANDKLYWSLSRSGAAIVTRGSLGIDLSGSGTFADEGAISEAETRSVNTTWTPPYGERATIPDQFNEETLTLFHPSHGALSVKLQTRAYNEGVAFRYLVNGTGTLTMSGEKTTYPLPGGASVWVSPASQGAISKVAITSMGNGMERPLTAELSPDLFVALGEAGGFDHARMKFSRVSGTSTLVPVLGGSATFTDTLATPWRYMRVAATATGLLDSNHMLWNLSEPSRVADTSWLKPGKVIREVTLTTDGGKACVDFAAGHGIDYVHFDAGWYGNEYDSASDATTVTVDPARSPGPLDLQGVIDYAKSKNVGVILYVNRRALETQLDEILPLYKQWGVSGIKFGFVNTGSQQWTKWLHDSIEKCAAHQLMVNVHDDYRMMGVERTLPNFMTAEGIRGDEESPPNEMVLRTIFTRCLAGAGDQTNCYFAPRVPTMGSHASQLAKSVLIYSPWQYLYWYDSPADSPDIGGKSSVIQEVPELSFFARLPTVWDETRWLQGHPDTHAVVARRKGEAWFLGGLNGTTAREFTIPLDFLPADQNFRLELYRDDSAVNTVTDVQIDVGVVDRTFTIVRPVGSRNGLAAILTPTSDPLAPPSATVETEPPPPPPPPGTIRFEPDEGYPAPGGIVNSKNSTAADAPFDGVNGWARSISSDPGMIHASSDSGEYTGGQTFGPSGTGTCITGLRGAIQPAAANLITFDARYNTGITVGFMKDGDADGLLDSGDCGMGFGVGGATTVRIQRRNAAFGTETASPLGGTNGQWYRFRVEIGASAGGQRPVTMAVRNLSTGADLDFDTTAPGIQPWSFTVTDAEFGPAPEDADGLFIRLTSSARLDNLRVTIRGTPYQAWIEGFPGLRSDQIGPADDPNGDNLANLFEFVFDGDPRVSGSAVRPAAGFAAEDLLVRFRRRADAKDFIHLALQHTTRLDDPAGWVEVPITADSGTDGTVSWWTEPDPPGSPLVTVRIPSAGGPRRFARLVASLP